MQVEQHSLELNFAEALAEAFASEQSEPFTEQHVDQRANAKSEQPFVQSTAAVDEAIIHHHANTDSISAQTRSTWDTTAMKKNMQDEAQQGIDATKRNMQDKAQQGIDATSTQITDRSIRSEPVTAQSQRPQTKASERQLSEAHRSDMHANRVLRATEHHTHTRPKQLGSKIANTPAAEEDQMWKGLLELEQQEQRNPIFRGKYADSAPVFVSAAAQAEAEARRKQQVRQAFEKLSSKEREKYLASIGRSGHSLNAHPNEYSTHPERQLDHSLRADENGQQPAPQGELMNHARREVANGSRNQAALQIESRHNEIRQLAQERQKWRNEAVLMGDSVDMYNANKDALRVTLSKSQEVSVGGGGFQIGQQSRDVLQHERISDR